jgi:hypothetical protein
MKRQRMTWGGSPRQASAHPATPWEGESHPAAQPDPEADAYESGDPSAWGEDPHPPPYRTSPAPAVPYDDGGYRHPATQPGAPAKNAGMNVRAAVERRASKCIHIATAMLGESIANAAKNGDKIAESMIEDQAFDLMDLSDDRIASTLRRIEAATMDEEALLRKMVAGEDEEEVEVEVEEESDEKAAKKASEQMFAMIEGLKAEIEALKAGKHAEAPAEDDEALLASMLSEEAKMAEEAKMGCGEGYMADEAPVMAEDDAMGLDDPMGMYDANMASDEDQLLASLFATHMASEKKSEEEDEEEDTDEAEVEFEADDKKAEDKDAGKKASALRPQPKRASTGAKVVGTQTRTASATEDMGDLARLWSSAPDVSKIFG